MKQPSFLHVNTNSHNLKVDQKCFMVHGQKWVWPVWSVDSKIDCISQMNSCNKLIFSYCYKFRKAKSQ